MASLKTKKPQNGHHFVTSNCDARTHTGRTDAHWTDRCDGRNSDLDYQSQPKTNSIFKTFGVKESFWTKNKVSNYEKLM